jgi:hypothetical protein
MDLNLTDVSLNATVNHGVPIVRKFAGAGTEESAAIPYLTPMYAQSSTVTPVASSVTSVILLASNTDRKAAIIANDSTALLYILLKGEDASTNNYSATLSPIAADGKRDYFTLKGDDYAGEITGIWESANGHARVTELS